MDPRKTNPKAEDKRRSMSWTTAEPANDIGSHPSVPRRTRTEKRRKSQKRHNYEYTAAWKTAMRDISRA